MGKKNANCMAWETANKTKKYYTFCFKTSTVEKGRDGQDLDKITAISEFM